MTFLQRTPHRGEHIRTAPHQPTHPPTYSHRQTHFKLAAQDGTSLELAVEVEVLEFGSRGVTHTDTPLHFCSPIGPRKEVILGMKLPVSVRPAALGNSPPRRPALPRH